MSIHNIWFNVKIRKYDQFSVEKKMQQKNPIWSFVLLYGIALDKFFFFFFFFN